MLLYPCDIFLATLRMLPPFEIADDIVLQHESSVVSLPRLVVSHLDREAAEDFWYHLVHFSVGELRFD